MVKFKIIPIVMKTEEEEEEDQESASSSQVLPSGIKTGAWLPVFHHQHAGSERVLHISSSVCLCVCVHLCVCKERARKGPDCLQGPPTQMSRGTGALGRERRGVCS